MLAKFSGIVACLTLACFSSGQGVFKPVSSPIQKVPVFKAGNPFGMYVRDQIGARKPYAFPDAQLQPAYEPYYFLSWKEASRKVEFQLQHVGDSYSKARVSVYAYQEPPVGSDQPELKQLGQIQLVEADPTKSPQLVYSRQLGSIGKGSHFILDFSGFTPAGAPSPPPTVRQSKLIPKTGGEDSPVPGFLKNRVQDVWMNYLVSTQGYLRFFVRIEPTGGHASFSAVVDYGEPQPRPGSTNLEVQVTAKKGEVQEDTWGAQRQIYGTSPYGFRWNTEVSTEKTARWQLSDRPFPENAVLFKDPNINLASGEIKELAVPAIPQGANVLFWANIAPVLPDPVDEQKYFYLRVLLFNEDGTLAGAPSNAVRLILLPAKAPVPPQDSNYLTFTADLVGYKPPYFWPTDPYQYLLTRTPDSDIGEWQKLTGNPNPVEGDRVYLPPAPPPEDKAWYEKVVDAITWTLSKLQDFAQTMEWYADTLAGAFPMMANFFANAIISETGIDKVASATGIDHAIAAAGLVKGQALTMVNIASNPDYFAANVLDQAGLPAAQWIDARGKVTQAMYQAAYGARPTNPEIYTKLLVPNPEYATHPPIAYLRIHATQLGDKSIPIVSSPGTYHLAAMGWYSDPDSPDLGKHWQDLYNKSVTMPSMCDGMTIIVPIAMDYHWMYYQNPKQWMLRYNQSTAIRWTLDYNELKVVQGTAGWGN